MKFKLVLNMGAKDPDEIIKSIPDLLTKIKEYDLPRVSDLDEDSESEIDEFPAFSLYLTREHMRMLFNDRCTLGDPFVLLVCSRSTDIIDYFDIDDIAVNYRDCLIPLRMTTDKELRPVHNIRKMFIAGAFTDEFTLHEVWRKLYDTAKEEEDV
jgi:hypothetical protein